MNDKKEKKKILSTLLYELNHCEKFVFSVAFLSKSGVAVIINTLEMLRNKGIKGEILVSQYLNFTQPEALRTLKQFDNIDLRIVTYGEFHAKGYFFKHKNHYSMIVGSSNLTAPALTTNKEWNLYICAMEDSKIIDESLNIFYDEFLNAQKVDDNYISHYESIYKFQAPLGLVSEQSESVYSTRKPDVLKPNAIQIEAMRSLNQIRVGNNKIPAQNKAMIISATGTGKTFLSVFDAQNFNPKRLLFVVHRANIARSAMNSYERVFGSSKTMGLFTGFHRSFETDFVFSTIQTLSKDENLNLFDPEDFDYIVIDESHHAGAASYQKILKHFKPKFLLGMTATPERTDGYNIFADFNHNIAIDVRLNRALDENMLCPFHYFGVTDVHVSTSDDCKEVSFLELTSDERVKQIIDKSKLYGTDSGVIHGLVFCNVTNVAKELSDKFNKLGYKTIALTGKDSEEIRDQSIDRLERTDGHDKLDYIFTVDIFNEGIDIPRVNQIIMLRPTQSAIVFVQQLGRGLRKISDKEYLTVIDFIGNYQSNYLIPVALYGDSSYSKDRLRKLIAGGSNEIPGSSTVNFDQISKEKIFKAIDSANMKTKKDLDKDYDLLKFKLGRIPRMMDFIEHGSRDPMLYVQYSKSYYNYLVTLEEAYRDTLNEKEKKLLECFGLYIANGKRYEELFIIRKLLEKENLSFETLIRESDACKYIDTLTIEVLKSSFINLNFMFMRESLNKKQVSLNEKYGIELLNVSSIENEEIVGFSEQLKKALKNQFFHECFIDQLTYAEYVFKLDFIPQRNFRGFVLYRKYSRRDVFRILGWDENPVAKNVGGYMIHKDKRDCAIFVNYHKEEDISNTTKYEDEFISPELFQWISKSKRTLSSPDVMAIKEYQKYGMRLPLFIKKHNDEGTEFYYMGDVEPQGDQFVQEEMMGDKGKSVSVVKMIVKLKIPVNQEMYEYIREKY